MVAEVVVDPECRHLERNDLFDDPQHGLDDLLRVCVLGKNGLQLLARQILVEGSEQQQQPGRAILFLHVRRCTDSRQNGTAIHRAKPHEIRKSRLCADPFVKPARRAFVVGREDIGQRHLLESRLGEPENLHGSLVCEPDLARPIGPEHAVLQGVKAAPFGALIQEEGIIALLPVFVAQRADLDPDLADQLIGPDVYAQACVVVCLEGCAHVGRTGPE
ncbi:hypothetical protein ACVWZW_001685 [Bradyrhizobium sp. F1.13.4]